MIKNVITLENLVKAIQNSINKRLKLSTEAVEDLALSVLYFFGHDDLFEDRLLTSDERDIFYMFEDEKILTTKRYDEQLNQKPWRIYYWTWNKKRIFDLAKPNPTQSSVPVESEYDVYDNISDDAWHRD